MFHCDELVLFAGTNQTAVDAIPATESAPAVLAVPDQTPLTATLAWVAIPSDAWNASTRITTANGTVPLKLLFVEQLRSVRAYAVC